MRLSPNAKRYILREVKDLYPKDNDIKEALSKYDEVYYMLARIIEYEDIDNYDIAGLDERLPNVINRIVEGKLTRNDVLMLFPQVWNKFESYVKKLLFIVDPDGYDFLAQDGNNTLPYYLDKLDVAHRRKGDKGHSEDYTYVFYRAKELRKIEAHVCELWSMNKYYQELAISLLSYLLLTEHCLEKIKKVIVSNNIQSKIPLYSGRLVIAHPCFFSILPVICDYPGIDFSNLKGIKRKTREGEKNLSFDSNGFDERKDFEYSEGNNKRKGYARFEWDFINKHVLTQRIYESERFWSCNEEGEWIPDGGGGRDSLRKYELNDEGEITRFTKSTLIKNEEKPVGEVCLIYLPEGGVEIYQYEYVFEDNAPPRPTEPIAKRVLWRICFNQKGLITSIDKPYKDSFVPTRKYSYNENGALERIDISYKGHIEVEVINDDVFFRLFDEYTGDDRIVNKLVFHEATLTEVIAYEEDPHSGEERITHTLFEYFEGLNSRHYFTKL